MYRMSCIFLFSPVSLSFTRGPFEAYIEIVWFSTSDGRNGSTA